jgi:hypothetical protein
VSTFFRKRANVVILPQDNLNTIIEKVRKCLPVNFIWNDMAEPVRFQRAKEQPQHTLELLESEPVVTIFELLDDIRAKSMKRYTDLNFNYHSVSFWIFGFWTSKTQQTPPITPPLSKSNMGDILSVQQTDALQMNDFEQLAVEFMNSNYTERKFSSFFGVSLRVIVDVWNFIRCNQNGVTKEHLLWTVYFLKHTPPDEVNKFKVTT